MKTDIVTLDRLLGLEPHDREIEPGSIILLRGGPGSGKTTLALQIMAEYLKKSGAKGAFVSIELEPHRILTHVKTKFRLGLPAGSQDPATSSLANVRIISREERTGSGDTVAHAISAAKGELETLGPARQVPRQSGASHNTGPNAIQRAFKALGATIRGHDPAAQVAPLTEIQRVFKALSATIHGPDQGAQPEPKFIVIDSLNALVSMLSVEFPNGFGKQDLRGQLQELVKASRNNLQESVLLFTAEYHPTESPESFGSLVSESFVCDIEILLRPEPVAGETSLPASAMNQLGYAVERRQVERHSGKARNDSSWSEQAVEVRSFCRVLKSRWSHNQSRRCQYDIVEGQGLVFDETYPGDGELLLFYENQQQRDIWEDFFQNDIPVMFPALRYATFDVKRLQRVFASQRAYGNRRIDLYMGSFDGYWLEFFTHLSHRALIRDTILSHHHAPAGIHASPRFWNLVCDIHQKILDNQPDNAQLDSQIQDSSTSIGLEPAACQRVIEHAVEKIRGGQSAICNPIPEDDLRLFGEARSEFLEQVAPSVVINGGKRSFTSIPYNANFSFLVYRRDLLNVEECKKKAADLASEIRTAFSVQRQALIDAYPGQYRQLDAGAVTDAAVRLLADERTQALLQGGPPETWEELIALCIVSNKQFLIETQTFDTIMCTILEMIWSFGGDLEVRFDYNIGGNRAETEMHVFRAIYLLRYMFYRGVVPPSSTMDVGLFNNDKVLDERTERYLFGRHWYSTIVNLLTATAPAGNGSKWFFPSKSSIQPEIAICQIPVSMLHFAATNKHPEHHSSWGVWHFGILSGSENGELAARLANHFMSSHKIREMASAGAVVPTVKEFYSSRSQGADMSRYAGKRCLDIVERPNIKQPLTTYGELYRDFFPNARNRSRIFDYHRTMQELHGVVESIRCLPLTPPPDTREATRLAERITQAFDAIVALRDKEMMVY